MGNIGIKCNTGSLFYLHRLSFPAVARVDDRLCVLRFEPRGSGSLQFNLLDPELFF